MAADKKISAKEAGIAVLKKFEELLTKAQKEHKHIGLDKQHGEESKAHSMKKDDQTPPTPTAESGQTVNSQIGKSDSNPDEKQDAKLGEQVEEDVAHHMDENKEAEQKEGHMKGHIKLAKFIGHIQGKRSAKGNVQDSGNNTPAQPINGNPKELDKGETGHEKGVHTDFHTKFPEPTSAGTSYAGMHAKEAKTDPKGAKGGKLAAESLKVSKDVHQKKLTEIKAMPKPKLPG